MSQNRIVGVIAPKGSGKTHFTSTALREDGGIVAVFDMLREPAYGGLATEIVQGSPRQFAAALAAAQPGARIVYRPATFSIKDGEEYCPAFPWFCRLCYLKGDVTMVVDEAHQLCNAYSLPDELRYVVRLGRHRRVNLFYVTMSFSAVSRILTENTDEFIFFKIIEPRDLDGIRSRCGTETERRVKNLRKLEFVEGGVVPGEVVKWDVWNGLENKEPEIETGASAKA